MDSEKHGHGPNAAFVERIKTAASASGDRPFLTLLNAAGQATELGYKQLLNLAETWRQRYADAGLEPGERIVVIHQHSVKLYAAYLGALMGGYCPAYFAPPSEKVSQHDYAATVALLLDQIRADFVVTSDELVERLARENGWFVGLDNAGRYHRTGRERVSRQDGGTEPYLFLQFSSGTTGIKKGVGITEAALLWQVDAYAASLAATPGDRIVSWLPLYHDMGLITCFFLPLLKGIPLVAMSPFDWVKRPAMLLDAVTQFRATLCWLPNFAFNFLATRSGADQQGWDLASLRAVVNCSEPVIAESHTLFANRFAGARLRPGALATCYAMAESTFAVTAAGGGIGGTPAAVETVDPQSLQRDQRVRAATTGRAVMSSGTLLTGTRVQILATSGEILPEGSLGEIAVSSPSLFGGYIGNPQATKAAMAEGQFRTGDLGYLRNGQLFVVGRIKDTIIIGGKNIYPQDIETVCNGVSGVIPGRVVAFGIDDAGLGTQSLVVLAETAAPDRKAQDQLARAIRTAIVAATDVVPADIRVKPHMWLKKSTSGKISRAMNRERYLEEQQAAAQPAPAPASGGDAERILRGIVIEIATGSAEAAEPPFGDDAPLIDEGWIDSFSYVNLLARLEEHFGAKLSDQMRAAPDRYQTIRAILGLIRGAAPAAPAKQETPSGDRRQQLAPQLKDVDQQPFEWLPYVMRRGAANYRSGSTNTDRLGCRVSWREGKPLPLDVFLSARGKRGVVLGNSFAFGVGTTGDARHVASELNASAAGADTTWYNFSLRASNLTQERLFFELYAQPPVDEVVWISGVNNLVPLIIGEGLDPNPAPFLGERIFISQLTRQQKLPAPAGGFAERYKAMLRIAEIDISAIALRLGPAGRATFCLQPSGSWIDKAWCAEERELFDLFDRHGAAIRRAHHPKFLAQFHASFSADIAQICARWNVAFHDLNLEPEFKRPDWLFLDRIHMTDLGHRLVAEAIARRLAAQPNRAHQRKAV